MGPHIRTKAISLFRTLIACILVVGSPATAQTLAEALDSTNLVWTTGGDAAWFAQPTNTHDSVDAVRSGMLGSNQTSWIETTVTGPGTVSYWTLTSSSLYPLSSGFTINGSSPDGLVIQVYPFGTWHSQTNDLYEGSNVLRWSASDYWGVATAGFVVLDEFSVGPPRPLAITYQPRDETVFAGEWAYVYVQAVGTPPFRYQWTKDGTNIADATNGWIYFEPATTNDAGVYSAIVNNSQGFAISSNALLTVLPAAAPFFTYEPGSATAYSGLSLSFWAGVSGSPAFAYQWRKDGTNLPGANWSSLSLTNVSLADAGSYTLFVTNAYGSVESSNAVLTVIPSVAPVSLRHPRSLEVAEGVNTWMSVSATGTPDPSYAWKRIGDIAPPWPPEPPLPPISINSGPSRTFNNVTTNDAGVYFATASNPGGVAVSRDALLTVLPPMSLKGSWGIGAEDIFVINGLAFLACGTNGLTILDVSNPTSPQLLGSYNTAGYASAVRVSGDRAFVADGSMGLQIISVTNPSNPILVGGYNTPGYANDVAVRSNLAFVADRNSGLLILDVSNSALPSLVGSYSTNLSPDNISLSGNLAYLSSLAPVIGPGSNYWVGGMLIVDVSNPMQPTEVGRWGTSALTTAARDQLVFSGSSVISVTNPAQPIVISSLAYHSTNFPSIPRISTIDVHVVNDLVYVAGSSGDQLQLFVFDVRDPVQPIPVGHSTTPGSASTLWVDGNYVYVVGYDSPLLIIETPFNPRPVSSPVLSLKAQNGLGLQIHGRRGLHYEVEYADGLTGFPWQTFRTILLTNENAVIEVPSDASTRFFRLKQLD